MPPSVLLTPSETPSDFERPSPALPGHTFDGSAFQSSGAEPARYFWKFSVVPDSSERKNTEIAVDGSVTPGFRSAICLSSQVLMAPRKILAATAGVRTSLSTPGTL